MRSEHWLWIGIITGPIVLGIALIILGWRIETNQVYIRDRDMRWEAAVRADDYYRRENIQKIEATQQQILTEIAKLRGKSG